MPSVGDVAALLRVLVEHTRLIASRINGARHTAAEAVAEAQAIADGSNNPLVEEFLGRWRQGQEALEEAAALYESGAATMEQYADGLASSGTIAARGDRTPPPSPPTSIPPRRPPSGWDAAPDLAASRDRMTRLGEIPVLREVHILDGDFEGDGGGHRWDSETPGKTKFPRAWDDEKIRETITDVAHRPDTAPIARERGGWICEGIREGVTIRVVTNADGSVWTAHPLRGPGIETNPR